MKRASFLLETARLDREYTLEEVSKKTKIPLKYLKAFEQEIIPDFPQEPYCSLMLREYASLLGLNPDEVISIFRRDYAKKVHDNDKRNSFLSFTPQFTYTLIITVLILLFSSYLILEYVKFNQPPILNIDWPSSYSKIVEIKGKTNPESTIKVNQDLVVVDQNGFFSKRLELATSEAKIIVESTSPAGKTTVEEKVLK